MTATADVRQLAGAPAERPRRTRFYMAMAIVMFVIATAGFGPGMVFTGARKAALSLAVGLHGLFFAAWLVLFFLQTMLVGRGRIRLHRALGYVGAGLAVLMLASGYTSAVAMARRGYDLSGDLRIEKDHLAQLVFQLGDLLTFAVLVGMALTYRRRPEVHKRLMLFATLGGLMPAPLAHLQSHIPVVRDIGPLVLVPLVPLFFSPAVHDRLTRGRIHPVSLWTAIALLVWANLRAIVIGPSPAWRAFAAWLVG